MNSQKPSYLGEGGRTLGGLGGESLAAAPPLPAAPGSVHDEPAVPDVACGMRLGLACGVWAPAGPVAAERVECARAGVLRALQQAPRIASLSELAEPCESACPDGCLASPTGPTASDGSEAGTVRGGWAPCARWAASASVAWPPAWLASTATWLGLGLGFGLG